MGFSVLLVEGIPGRAWREGGCMLLAPGTWRGWTGSEGEQSRDRDRDSERHGEELVADVAVINGVPADGWGGKRRRCELRQLDRAVTKPVPFPLRLMGLVWPCLRLRRARSVFWAAIGV